MLRRGGGREIPERELPHPPPFVVLLCDDEKGTGGGVNGLVDAILETVFCMTIPSLCLVTLPPNTTFSVAFSSKMGGVSRGRLDGWAGRRKRETKRKVDR